MARERVIEREFMQTEGLKNARLESKIGPAQSSVNQIVKAGAALEKGDASGAAQALSGLAGGHQPSPVLIRHCDPARGAPVA